MKEFLIKHNIAFREDVALCVLTGMTVNGTLPLVAYPDSVDKLEELYKEVHRQNYTYDVFGALSNTYLSNRYRRDIVIMTSRVRDVKEEADGSMWVGCGYNLTKFAREMCSRGITGYEGFIGIPGTVGAAAINNSGAFNSSMSKVVLSVKTAQNTAGGGKILLNKDLQYEARSSILKTHEFDGIVLAVKFDVSNKEVIETIKARVKQNTDYRRKYIDGKRKSLGSVFVASTMKELHSRHRLAILAKKIVNAPLKAIFHNAKLNTYLDFLFLGHPSLSKHCDSLNRFCWERYTTEEDFHHYLSVMQRLANNKLKLEIEIRT